MTWETVQWVLLVCVAFVALHALAMAADAGHRLNQLARKLDDRPYVPPAHYTAKTTWHREDNDCSCACGRKIRAGKVKPQRVVK